MFCTNAVCMAESVRILYAIGRITVKTALVLFLIQMQKIGWNFCEKCNKTGSIGKDKDMIDGIDAFYYNSIGTKNGMYSRMEVTDHYGRYYEGHNNRRSAQGQS